MGISDIDMDILSTLAEMLLEKVQFQVDPVQVQGLYMAKISASTGADSSQTEIE
jgi:hypothetical protein